MAKTEHECCVCRKIVKDIYSKKIKMISGSHAYVCFDCSDKFDENQSYYQCLYIFYKVCRCSKGTNTFVRNWLDCFLKDDLIILEYVMVNNYKQLSDWIEANREFKNPIQKAKYYIAIFNDKFETEKDERNIIKENERLLEQKTKQIDADFELPTETVKKKRKRQDITKLL